MKPGEFVTADHHFDHRRICEFTGRIFRSVEAMNEALIEAWNRKVPEKGAIVYHLGDFCFTSSTERIIKLAGKLNGTIRLVVGNHDKIVKRKKESLEGKAFEWIKGEYVSKTPDGTRVVMAHFPKLTWEAGHYGSWMLHGHSHGTLYGQTRRIDIGVDVHPKHEPFSYEEIVERMKGRRYLAVDHHGGDEEDEDVEVDKLVWLDCRVCKQTWTVRESRFETDILFCPQCGSVEINHPAGLAKWLKGTREI